MTVTGQEITDYVDRVRAALADLSPKVRDELTEDLPEHLAEVAAEADGTLVDRLGTPEAYAAELRAAAGAEGHPERSSLDRRLTAARNRVTTQLRALDTQLGPLLGYASVSEFLRPLRPAWWLLRGWLVALLVSALHGESPGLLPRFDGRVLGGLFLLVGAVLASVWLGHRSAGFRGWPRQLLRLGTAVLLLFTVPTLFNLDQRANVQLVSVYNPYESVQDVFVYDDQGRLVRNAQLFDQNGSPIDLGWRNCEWSGNMPEPTNAYPYCPDEAPFGPTASVPTPTAPVPGPTEPVPDPSAPTASASPTPGTPSGNPPTEGVPATPTEGASAGVPEPTPPGPEPTR
ncbi:hypothetical protein AB0C02_23375 [Micromonospora sp. NPDC048999]|uniref:HAAS signaling domain-containing protein n=1 Tax=Micromonospora sp. NPDC048999 TaxID=3155391 RepID=UPI0033D7E9E2